MIVKLCIAQRERGVRLVSLTSCNGFSSFQCHFSREVILTSSACNTIFVPRVPVEPPHWCDRQLCNGNGWLCWNCDNDLVLVWMGMQCGWFVMRNGVDYRWFRGNDYYFQFPPFSLNFHHFRCGSSLFACSHSDNTLSNAAEWALRWMGSGCCWLRVTQRDELKKRWRAPASSD